MSRDGSYSANVLMRNICYRLLLMTKNYDSIRPIVWRDSKLFLLDQRVLPHEYTEIELLNAQQVADAIQDMVVRGAPAIGIAAAYGVVLASAIRYADGPFGSTAGPGTTRSTQNARPIAIPRP